MRFKPRTAAEIASDGLLPEGEYDFEVTGAEERTSKANNEMLVIDLSVYDSNGRTRKITDYLVATEGGMRKVQGFAAAIGKLAEYDRGELSPVMVEGCSGRAFVKQDAKNPDFPPKNVVGYYCDPSRDRASAPVRQKEVPKPAYARDDLDDESIPF